MGSFSYYSSSADISSSLYSNAIYAMYCAQYSNTIVDHLLHICEQHLCSKPACFVIVTPEPTAVFKSTILATSNRH